MCLDEGDQLVNGNRRHDLQGKSGRFVAVRSEEEKTWGRGQRACTQDSEGYHIRLVLCGLRVITDGEITVAGNSTISISADVCGGIWMASTKEERGISGWLEWHEI